MHTTLRRSLTTAAVAAIALGTVALQPAEARKRHHHNREAAAVVLGTIATMALIAAANQNGHDGYSVGYGGYPYGPGHSYYWNGYRYVPVYGPGYGSPVPPPGYYYHR